MRRHAIPTRKKKRQRKAPSPLSVGYRGPARSAQTGESQPPAPPQPMRRMILTIEIETARSPEKAMRDARDVLVSRAGISTLSIGVTLCRRVLRTEAKQRLIDLINKLDSDPPP